MDTEETTTGQTLPINGIQLYFEDRGEGDPLLLVHGFTGSGEDWQHLLPEAPEGMRLIVPDLRGHGRTTNPLNVFTFQQAAWDLFTLLDRLDIERVKAIGLSGGALTLLHMATQQPSRIEAMVLVSGAHYFSATARGIMRQMTVESRTEEDWEEMRQRHKHGDDQIRALWRQGNAFKDSYDDVNFTPPYLATIEARTLLVHGDRDPLYPAPLALELYNAIPRAHLWVIPNAGHVPVFGAHAGQFVDTALSFLRSPDDEVREP